MASVGNRELKKQKRRWRNDTRNAVCVWGSGKRSHAYDNKTYWDGSGVPHITPIAIEDVVDVKCVQWRIVCPFCGKTHVHGAGAGIRGSHCNSGKGGSAGCYSYYVEEADSNEYASLSYPGMDCVRYLSDLLS